MNSSTYKTSNVTVEDFRYNPETLKVTRRYYEIPDEYEPTQITSGVARQIRDPKKIGKRTKLPRTHYIATLIYQNEIQACMGKASDRHGMLRALRKEYPNWETRKAVQYWTKFFSLRKKFNEGTLYPLQPMPALFCFYYTPQGFIQHPTKKSLLTFDHCKRILSTEKFMDPRFFSATLMQTSLENREKEKVDKYADWHIPPLAEIARIEATIGKPLFNSITFPDGFGFRK